SGWTSGANWSADTRHSRRVGRAKSAGATGSRDPGSEKGDHGRDSAPSFYGEASRVQPDRAGFSGIATVVADDMDDRSPRGRYVMSSDSTRTQSTTAKIAPWLSVADATRAVEYYKAAFGAVELERLEDEAGNVVVPQLS